MDWTSLLANINLTVGAIAFGLWLVLMAFWLRRTKGVLRIALVWIALNVVVSLGIRLFQQLQNFNNDDFPPLDWIRLVFNFSWLALGAYLAKNSGRINKEGELS